MDKLVEDEGQLFDALILGQRSKILEAFDKVHLSKLQLLDLALREEVLVETWWKGICVDLYFFELWPRFRGTLVFTDTESQLFEKLRDFVSTERHLLKFDSLQVSELLL